MAFDCSLGRLLSLLLVSFVKPELANLEKWGICGVVCSSIVAL